MRDQLKGIGRPDHLALAYSAWAPTENEGKIPDKKRAEWLNDLEKIQISEDYNCTFKRWKESFCSPGDRTAELTLTSRLLVGHGNTSATDVGLTVHHTWGVPIIPGSALKGLLAHYVDAVYGPDEPGRAPWLRQGEDCERAKYQGITWNGRRIQRGPGAIYRALFGAPDAQEDEEMRGYGLDAGASAGFVVFHDALYIPNGAADKPFATDVLTVHQKSYYDTMGDSAPNDYDDPNPVSFLTVRPKCKLLLALSGPEEWTKLAADLLKEALIGWGVGGKTSAGYGICKVEDWKQLEPRRSKEEQVLIDLKKLDEKLLLNNIEDWLLGKPVTGPIREYFATTPETAPRELLDIVRELGNARKFPETWSDRQKNKKADEKKKERARALIEAWDRLFPKK